MRVVLSTFDSRGGVEPFAALAVRLRELGAEATLCAPPDCVERVAELGVPFVPVGQSVHSLVHASPPPSVADVPKRAAEIIAGQFEQMLPVAEGCDAIVASGLMPHVAAARSVAERLGIRSVKVGYCPIFLPSPQNPPVPLPGRPYPPGVTDRKVLHDLEVESYNALFGAALNANRAAVGLPAVDDVHGHIYGGEAWLAADPTIAPLPEPLDVEVVQTGAWIVPDERPLAADLEAFLAAGTPPVYVGLGSVRAPEDFARVAVEAARAQGRRVLLARGWTGLSAIDDSDDCFVVGEVNQQALFRRVAAVVHHGGAGTTTTATRAGVPQVVVPQLVDQPYWASRVAALGVGVAHDGPVPTVGSLSAALRTALDPEVRTRAAAVSELIRTDGTTVAATLLLDGAG